MISAVNYAAFTASRKTQSGVRYRRPLEISILMWWMSSRECQTFQVPSISSSVSTPPARSHTKESSYFQVPFNRPHSHYRWKWDFPDVGSFHYHWLQNKLLRFISSIVKMKWCLCASLIFSPAAFSLIDFFVSSYIRCSHSRKKHSL